MKTILVASSKGGVGKTTVATQLAAQAAIDGLNTVLVDADPQGSSTRWAERRADLSSAVLPIDGTRKAWQKRIPEDAQRVFIDAPAGAMAGELEGFLDVADAVVVPVPPSALDIEATVPFLNAIAKHPRVRKGELPVALVGNKLKPWTNASQQAMDVLRQWGVPLVAELRDSQSYVLLTGLGRSLFDYQSANVRQHQEDWAPLLRWLYKAR
ncbi:CMP-binding protein [Lysobacter oculi]|uniref:CMP-binding protein n=1 Tax=Solilutibacter oculi TaxID=2698682 RepID=A0A344J7C8_9GAMM|nr:ParA family protein [Lysobacter oculi]AXA84938.1 CMP-binding protein [Lysobacter oculi]